MTLLKLMPRVARHRRSRVSGAIGTGVRSTADWSALRLSRLQFLGYERRASVRIASGEHRAGTLAGRCAKRDHCHRVALFTVWYNFVRMHKAIRMTPALAAEVENRLWSLEELVGRTSL